MNKIKEMKKVMDTLQDVFFNKHNEKQIHETIDVLSKLISNELKEKRQEKPSDS